MPYEVTQLKFLTRFFSKSSEDLLAKGDTLLAAERWFEARTAYEDGLQRHLSAEGSDSDALGAKFTAGIASANRELAKLNLAEGEHALAQGLTAKARDHLELAKSLTDEVSLREKADALYAGIMSQAVPPSHSHHGGGGCGSCGTKGHGSPSDAVSEDPDMDESDYYDLLIRQLPAEMYKRYAELGQEFACCYLAASREENQQALKLLENWFTGSERDIYLYEKGKILYRTGAVPQAETCFREAITIEPSNSLAHLALSLLLMDAGRLEEAAESLDRMIDADMLGEQTLMLRGDVCAMIGDVQGATRIFGELLSTPAAKPAAEKLCHLLHEQGREHEAAMVFKKFLKGCCH